MMVSARSRLAAGLITATAGAAMVVPVTATSAHLPSTATITVPGVELSAAVAPLLESARAAAATASAVAQTPGEWIINAYFALQPWVEYGVEVFAWVTEWLPWPIGLLAPQADIIYSGWEPFAESVAFALAYLVDGQFELVLPTLANGIQIGISTLIQNEIAWIASFFPPLPPIGFAEATAPVAAAGAVARARVAPEPAPAAQSEPATAATAETVVAQPETTESAAVVEAAAPEREVTAAAVSETEIADVEVARVERAEAAIAEPAPSPRAVRQSARAGLGAPSPAPAAAVSSAYDSAPAAAASNEAPEPKSRTSARAAR